MGLPLTFNIFFCFAPTVWGSSYTCKELRKNIGDKKSMVIWVPEDKHNLAHILKVNHIFAASLSNGLVLFLSIFLNPAQDHVPDCGGNNRG